MTADETAAVFMFTGGWGHGSGLVGLRAAPVPADGSVGLSAVLAAKVVEQFEQYRAQVPAPRLGVKGPYTDTE